MQMQMEILRNGPGVGSIWTYNDFDSYTSGVYITFDQPQPRQKPSHTKHTISRQRQKVEAWSAFLAVAKMLSLTSRNSVLVDADTL